MENVLHQRILVTGGCGFIGSAVVRNLYRNTNAQIAILDKLSYAADLAALEEALGSKRVCVHPIDLVDRPAVQELVQEFRPSIVLHLAAETHVDRSIDDPLRFVQTNIVGTATLLEAVRSYWGGLTEVERSKFRWLQISTDEVYGSIESPQQFRIDSPYQPNSPYAASKGGADHLVRAWWKTYGIPAIFTHSCNNYGPYQYPEKLIPLMIWKGWQGEDFPVYGKGLQVREWLYVDDHAAALVLIAARGSIGQTYHITSGEELPNIVLVEQLAEELQQALTAVERPRKSSIRFVEDRPGHDQRYSLSAIPLQQELGWRASTSWKLGLKQTVAWYLNHPEFFDKKRQKGYKGERLGCQIQTAVGGSVSEEEGKR